MLERGKLNSGEQQDYASGLVIGNYKGLPTVDHGGADAGYRSDMTRFPDQHFSAPSHFATSRRRILARWSARWPISFSQRSQSTGPAPAKQAEKPRAVALTVAQMDGVSRNILEHGKTMISQRFVFKDGKLQIDIGEDDFHALKPFAPEHFHVADVPWGDRHRYPLHRRRCGQAVRIWSRPSAEERPQFYELVSPFSPTAAQLARYRGEFVSEEIDPVYRISVQDGKLTLKRLKHKPDTFARQHGTFSSARSAHSDLPVMETSTSPVSCSMLVAFKIFSSRGR